MKISIISPVYNAELMLDELIDRIIKSIPTDFEDYEIILVDDYSLDNSWQKIEKLAKDNESIKGIKLGRNFGQHYAITAGLDFSNGDWVVVMDCDLQDRPEEIIELYKKAKMGFDIVLARRINRKDSIFKKLYSAMFYKILSYLVGSNYDKTIANFGIYSRKVINSFCKMRESVRVFPIMIKWLGYQTETIDVTHSERANGKSSYNFRKLINLAINIILAYSDKPIKGIIKVGLLISFSTFFLAIIVLYRYYLGKITVSGYTSIILSIWFLSGIIIVMLGVIGLYIGKIFEGVNSRPIYTIDQKINII